MNASRRTRRTAQALLGTTLVALTILLSLAALPAKHVVHAQSTKTVNVEFILDASGSMAEVDENGQTKIDGAKQVLNDVIDQLPEKEGVNVGFRVYGHKGNNSESGKDLSCKSTELKVPVAGVDKAALHQAGLVIRAGRMDANRIVPAGISQGFPGGVPGHDQCRCPRHRWT